MMYTHHTLRNSAVLIITILLVLSGCVTTAADGGSSAMSAKRKLLSSVYVFDGKNAKYRDDDAVNIDQMFYSFALIHRGQVSVSHWKNYKKFQAYIQKHPHITPILAVGGWGADGFSQAAATVEGRAVFVQDVLNLMQEYGFLGVDIDWEYPGSSAAGIQSSPDDRENYTLLLKALRDGLDTLTAGDGVPRRLCVALSGSPELIPSLQCARIGEIVDQVNLMTYDMQQPDMASHHSALYASHPVALSAAIGAQAYIRAGIPSDKIMLGVAFYGHRWATKDATPLYHPAAKKGTLPYSNIVKLIQKAPDAAYYDEVAQAPYYFNGKTFISYDDERSIAQKGLYVKEQNLMGLFAWEHGSDTSGTLIIAMESSLRSIE